MAVAIGRSMALTVAANTIQKITSCDLSLTNEQADATTNDSNGYKESIHSDAQATLDVTCKYEELTGVLAVLTEAFSTRTPAGLQCIYTPASSDTYTFNAHVTSLSISSPTSECVEVSFTLESTGAVTWNSP
jgi:predicted secreted protein